MNEEIVKFKDKEYISLHRYNKLKKDFDELFADYNKLSIDNDKLEDRLIETENWLRVAILQLMEIAKQNYFWITDQQIDNAKLVPIEFTIMGGGSVKFEKVERGVSDAED